MRVLAGTTLIAVAVSFGAGRAAVQNGAVRNRVAVDWAPLAQLRLDPRAIPPEVEMKAMLPNNKGRPSLTGPGKLVDEREQCAVLVIRRAEIP